MLNHNTINKNVDFTDSDVYILLNLDKKISTNAL